MAWVLTLCDVSNLEDGHCLTRHPLRLIASSKSSSRFSWAALPLDAAEFPRGEFSRLTLGPVDPEFHRILSYETVEVKIADFGGTDSEMSSADGDAAYAAAEKKLKGSMFGLSKDPDAAVDNFKRACNNYKVAGCCTDHPFWRLLPSSKQVLLIGLYRQAVI